MPSLDKEAGIEFCGDDLLSIAVADSSGAQALANQLRVSGGWTDVAAGMDSVVVQFDAASVDGDTAMRRIADCIAAGIPPLEDTGVLVEIPVVYGGEYGPDFDDVCQSQQLSAEELIALHTAREYLVELIGFTPGFAFVGGLDERLNVPRRPVPRQRVAAGSVGIAGGRTGLYALSVPGGWQIIGRTPSIVWDAKAEPPNSIRAGMRVRFVAISAGESGL